MTDVSNGLTGNGELEELTIGNAELPVKQLPIEEVDTLADELVVEYANPKFRRWYCGVIYEFGFERINLWRMRAASGTNPGGLFGYQVKQERARKAKYGTSYAADTPSTSKPDVIQPVRGDDSDTNTNTVAHSGVDTVYQPTDADMTPEGIDRMLTEAMGRFNIQDPGAGQKADQQYGDVVEVIDV